jgi:uncharacterized membrane protein YeaQ/YmgE (transglycosylase-associated protein family)
MFQVARSVELVAYVVFATLGLIIGVVAGALASITLKLPVQGMIKDAFLGAIGFLIVWLIITTTRYQHPFVAATIVAVILPACHQFVRLKHLNSAQK